MNHIFYRGMLLPWQIGVVNSDEKILEQHEVDLKLSKSERKKWFEQQESKLKSKYSIN